jgi:hypothetical protein
VTVSSETTGPNGNKLPKNKQIIMIQHINISQHGKFISLWAKTEAAVTNLKY